jgi:cell division protein FtsL
MATVAAYIKRTGTPMMAPAVSGEWEQPVDTYRLRPLPSEEIYFFSKKIDNSRVVRETDPAARRKAWNVGAKGIAAASLLMLLLMPKALNLVAGYQVHQLARDHDRLVNERSVLQLEEAKLVSPARLEQLARDLKLVTPDPKRVVVLDPKAEGALAMNVAH